MKFVKAVFEPIHFWFVSVWEMCMNSLNLAPIVQNLPVMRQVRVTTAASIGEPLSTRLESFLSQRYIFRYNLLNELPEYSCKDNLCFVQINQRILNTLCLEAQEAGLVCWDKDVVRLLHSHRIPNFHPFLYYMEQLPAWDGVDRITPLAQRISLEAHWVDGFRRWLLGLAGQWMGREERCANSLAPLLISNQQGWGKSTFCRLLIPDSLKAYYTDSFELTGQAGCEQKLAYFGLINLDEFDRLSEKRLPLLKNLMQMHTINFRKAHCASYSHMPRIASFIGTSNQHELLSDPTGSRRYLCVELCAPIDTTPLVHKQLFAQLKMLLLSGERSWLTSEDEAVWELRNRSYYRGLSLESLFFRRFRLVDAAEACRGYSSKEIFEQLSRHYPAAMCGVKSTVLSRMLTKWGVERVHTKLGNLYRVALMR
ncbi:MAG: VapE domain-containing protein [Phocaeicola sp.]